MDRSGEGDCKKGEGDCKKGERECMPADKRTKGQTTPADPETNRQKVQNIMRKTPPVQAANSNK